MKTIAAIAATAALAIAAPAFAASVEVEYKDLDLTTEAGQAQLEDRLDDAARQVCGMDQIQTGTRIRSREARDCYAGAKAQLSQQIATLVEKQKTAKGG
ncbi:UrcA family protein [Croceicoccus sediminis]|uniref:UrcA family protein n=1 Tax=Croceicoccus sediminis TaxID=2571150 RepID=UPI001184061E|nr:UrcA family protein [Croceicoccus sediminis]